MPYELNMLASNPPAKTKTINQDRRNGNTGVIAPLIRQMKKMTRLIGFMGMVGKQHGGVRKAPGLGCFSLGSWPFVPHGGTSTQMDCTERGLVGLSSPLSNFG